MLGIPEINIVARSPFDIGIMLVSDGVTDVMSSADMARILASKDYIKMCNPAEQVIQCVLSRAAQ